WNDGDATADATLDVLKLSALDACAGVTELELRLRDYFARNRPKGVPADADVAVEDVQGADVLSLGELTEVARQGRELIVGARPLDARDLALPGDTADLGVDTAELSKRAATAAKALDDARAALDGANVHDALLRASAVGVPGAVPTSTDATALRAQ